ncbi:hypothetical protein BKA93DRAFT_790378, partial [Sparassis latifolia]
MSWCETSGMIWPDNFAVCMLLLVVLVLHLSGLMAITVFEPRLERDAVGRFRNFGGCGCFSPERFGAWPCLGV